LFVCDDTVRRNHCVSQGQQPSRHIRDTRYRVGNPATVNAVARAPCAASSSRTLLLSSSVLQQYEGGRANRNRDAILAAAEFANLNWKLVWSCTPGRHSAGHGVPAVSLTHSSIRRMSRRQGSTRKQLCRFRFCGVAKGIQGKQEAGWIDPALGRKLECTSSNQAHSDVCLVGSVDLDRSVKVHRPRSVVPSAKVTSAKGLLLPTVRI